MVNQNDDNTLCIPSPNNSQEEELHSTHTFMWRCSYGKWTNITCSKAGTVEGLLKKSQQFKKFAEKRKDKELVIIKNGKAIAPHFPCTLIQKDEHLTVKFVKPSKKSPPVSSVSPRQRPFSQLVTFHVLTKGGKNIVQVIQIPFLRREIHEITVYAFKGEKVKQALKRDGRFLKLIFSKNFVLSHESTEVKTELSNVVDDLNDQTFRIILLDKSQPPNSQPGSLEEAYLEPEESQEEPTTECNGNDVTEEKRKEEQWSRFNDSLEGKKSNVSELTPTQNLLRVDFGQNADLCREVRTNKILMVLCDSVCQVRIDERPYGSGFLLFGRYVLTNGHVIKEVYNENSGRLHQKVSVHFSYESVAQTEGAVEVEEVVLFECKPDVAGCDWALLRLRPGPDVLPLGLLKHFGSISESGGICIIGHPGGGVKKMDPCLIVPPHSRVQAVEKHYWENKDHLQLVTQSFFEGVANYLKEKFILTYESSFYYSSSGSPVFDKHCKVIAMHSGGFTYPTSTPEIHSVLEFAHPLSAVMERLVILMVVRRRLDVLKEFLACHDPELSDMKGMVKKRNNHEFMNTVIDLLHSGDDLDPNTKEFLEFFYEIQEEKMEIE